MRPAFEYGSIEDGTSNMTCTCPDVRSSSAGAVPLYGTWTILMPVIIIRSSVERCADAPTPLEAKESWPGFVLARATSSFTEVTGSELVTHRISGATATKEIGAKLLMES